MLKYREHLGRSLGLAPVVQTLVSAIHRVNLYPADNVINHNYNKILKSDWFSTALISALIGQFNRTVRVMPK